MQVSSDTTGRAIFYAGATVFVSLAAVPFASSGLCWKLEASTNVKQKKPNFVTDCVTRLCITLLKFAIM
jgi:hypothetical protein